MSADLKKAVPSSVPLATQLPYGRQLIESDDIEAVVEALNSDYLTTGPLVTRFEEALSSVVGARESVACANGTAALYMASRALGLGPGSTVIVPAITFVATASAPHLCGARIVFADVDPETGLMRPRDLDDAIARAGRADAVFPVHFAGQACDMDGIGYLARVHEMRVVEDAAHALGSARIENGAIIPVGSNVHGDMTIFSFHPVKAIAMGEGGAVTANDPDLVRALQSARNHGLTRDSSAFVLQEEAFEAGRANPWYYELTAPGFNLRVADINCALGLSQIKKLPRFVAKRQTLADSYDAHLAGISDIVRPPAREPNTLTAWHIYTVRIDFSRAKLSRAQLMNALAADGIGTQVHYIPVHRQPYFARVSNTPHLPGAEAHYAQTLTLPLHPAMEEEDVVRVVGALKRHLGL